MILCLDVGNTLTCGGVLVGETQRIQCRFNTNDNASSDELGVFLRNVLRENGIDYLDIKQVALCSVVPAALHSLTNCCLKYFRLRPFVLQAGVKTGLRIRYANPKEVGADRIANAIAATELYPGKDLIIVDLGTATTLCAVSKERDYLGGIIVAGLKIAAQALETRAAQLPSVGIIKAERAVGRTTIEGIQAGLYYGTIGMLKELTCRMREEVFPESEPLVLGTSGFSGLFEDAGVFDEVVPDLVLRGLLHALALNR
jgi:type III pantothenate kinase